MFALKHQLLSETSTPTQSFVITSKRVKSNTTLNGDKRFFFPLTSPLLCSPRLQHTHTHTELSTSRKNRLRTQIPVQTDHRVEADERRQRRSTMKIPFANWKLLAECGGNWFSDVSKLETEGGGQNEKFGEWKVLTKLESHAQFLVGYWCMSPTSMSTLLWETPLPAVLSWSVKRAS